MVATSAETTMMVSNLETMSPKTKEALAVNDIIVTSHNTLTQMRKRHRSDVAVLADRCRSSVNMCACPHTSPPQLLADKQAQALTAALQQVTNAITRFSHASSQAPPSVAGVICRAHQQGVHSCSSTGVMGLLAVSAP